MYFSGNLLPALCTVHTYLYPPLFLPANEKVSLPVCSDCPSISSTQSSPVYAQDRSRSSLAIQLSCWTQAFITPPTLHVLLIFYLLPLSDRAVFRRPLAYICSIGNVIPRTSIVKNRASFVIPF